MKTYSYVTWNEMGGVVSHIEASGRIYWLRVFIEKEPNESRLRPMDRTRVTIAESSSGLLGMRVRDVTSFYPQFARETTLATHRVYQAKLVALMKKARSWRELNRAILKME